VPMPSTFVELFEKLHVWPLVSDTHAPKVPLAVEFVLLVTVTFTQTCEPMPAVVGVNHVVDPLGVLVAVPSFKSVKEALLTPVEAEVFNRFTENPIVPGRLTPPASSTPRKPLMKCSR
jgi:hypothetical protein